MVSGSAIATFLLDVRHANKDAAGDEWQSLSEPFAPRHGRSHIAESRYCRPKVSRSVPPDHHDARKHCARLHLTQRLVLLAVEAGAHPGWTRSVQIELESLQRYAQAVYVATDNYLERLDDADLQQPMDLSFVGLGRQPLGVMLSVLVLHHIGTETGEIACPKGPGHLGRLLWRTDSANLPTHMAAPSELIRMEGIDKSFPGVHALDDCSFDLRAGEVHALCGENGAGKSTLMKVLAGIYPKDAGRILLKGVEVDIPTPRSARDLGISIIHQELSLMRHLSVAHNIFIGREPRTGPFRVMLDERAINRQTQDLLDRLNIRLDARARVGDLTIAAQQMVEIARALSLNTEVLIMDEPTATLTNAEIDALFQIIRQLRDHGVGVVHISHRLEELRQIADRVTVMRDGRYVATVGAAETPIEQIISMMVGGRTLYEATPEIPQDENREVVLEVRNLTSPPLVRDVSFELRRGEILGFAGLVGAGRTEVARAVFGADPVASGEVLLDGKKLTIHSPSDAVQHGIAYLSEDRKRYGLA